MKNLIISSLILLVVTSSCNQEPRIVLDSWAESDSRSKIVDFVELVINPTSESFVEPKDRIAVFDLDGTILCEKPNYSEVAFSIYHINRMLDIDPSLSNTQPFKAVLESDENYLHNGDSLERVLITPFIGYSQKQYTDSVLSFFRTVMHPSMELEYEKLFYKPMIELIDYLKDNKFKVYISSYSQQSFVRSLTKNYLDIDKEQSIGSIVDLEFKPLENKASFIRQDSFLIKNLLKAELIEYQIGQAPILVAGNSNGDIEMLEYANLVSPHMVLIIDHDDSIREFEYRKNELIEKAEEKKWNIVSMKNDFKTIFQ